MADITNSTQPSFSLDDYFQSTAIGSIDKAIGNNLYGINHRQTPGLVPSNKDTYGLAFFVRPQLNMQTENIRNARIFSPLLTTNPLTIQRYIRCALDPRLVDGFDTGPYAYPAIGCPVLDNSNAFFAILTNNINSISGWPDVTAPTFTSKPGLYNEAFSMIDGITRYREVFDIDVNFRNTRGDPILYMFYIWLHYASMVHEGILMPYMDFITENEIDYNTRIYRLVLDQQKNTVVKIAATGAAFPLNAPTGSVFDYNNDKPYNDQNKDISIRFKCMGADFFDDILIKEFNETVCIFNGGMKDATRESGYIKLTKTTAGMFNNRGYPRINPNTKELEFWVRNSEFQARSTAFLESNVGPNSDEAFGGSD